MSKTTKKSVTKMRKGHRYNIKFGVDCADVEQEIEIFYAEWTFEKVLKGLNNGDLFTTLGHKPQNGSDIISIKDGTFKVIGKVVSQEIANAEYDNFDKAGE